MAFISIDGTITRSFFENKGFEVSESYTTKDGEERTQRYTVWFPQAQSFVVGDQGTFSGTLSTKIDSYVNNQGETKTVVVVSVNNAKAKTVATSKPAERVIDEDDARKYGNGYAPF